MLYLWKLWEQKKCAPMSYPLSAHMVTKAPRKKRRRRYDKYSENPPACQEKKERKSPCGNLGKSGKTDRLPYWKSFSTDRFCCGKRRAISHNVLGIRRFASPNKQTRSVCRACKLWVREAWEWSVAEWPSRPNPEPPKGGEAYTVCYMPFTRTSYSQ